MIRAVSSNLTLSNLPLPASLTPPQFEAILAERMASLKARLNAAGIPFDVEKLLTDPAALIEREDAYREWLDLKAMIDLAKGRMLAFARGSDQDHLGALFGPQRFMIDAGDPDATPPRPPVMEDDGEYQLRIQEAPEAYPWTGLTGGAYRQIALAAAAGALKDVRPLKRWDSKGHPVIDVILLARTGIDIDQDAVLAKVRHAFADEEATQLTDIVTVRWARILSYPLDVTIQVPAGPDPAMIRQAATDGLAAITGALYLIGERHPVDAFYAAARVGNVKKVLLSPETDIVPAPDEAASCTGIEVKTEIVDGR